MTIFMKRINRLLRKSFSLLIILSFMTSLSPAWGMRQKDRQRLLDQDIASAAPEITGAAVSHQAHQPLQPSNETTMHVEFKQEDLPSDLLPHALRLREAIKTMAEPGDASVDDIFFQYVQDTLKADRLWPLPYEASADFTDVQRRRLERFDPENADHFALQTPYEETPFSKAFSLFLDRESPMNPYAQFWLGIKFQYGFSCHPDPAKALCLLMASAQSKLYVRAVEHLKVHKDNFLPQLHLIGKIPEDLGYAIDKRFFKEPFHLIADAAKHKDGLAYTAEELHDLEFTLKRLPGDAKKYLAFYDELAGKLNSLLVKISEHPLTRSYILRTVGEASIVLVGSFAIMTAKAVLDPTGQIGLGLTAAAITTARYAVRGAEYYMNVFSQPIRSFKIVFKGQKLVLPLSWTHDHMQKEARYVALYLTLMNYKNIRDSHKPLDIMNTLVDQVEEKLYHYAAEPTKSSSFTAYFVKE
jgi:hypothetical protein